MPYKNGQKAARLREIAARLKEIDAEDSLIQGEERSSPDGRQQIAEFAVGRRQLRQEREELLSDPDPEPGPIREEIARMWAVVASFHIQIDGMDDRIGGVTRRQDVLSAQLGEVTRQQGELSNQLAQWFQDDANARHHGRAIAAAYRLVLLIVVAADLVIRVWPFR